MSQAVTLDNALSDFPASGANLRHAGVEQHNKSIHTGTVSRALGHFCHLEILPIILFKYPVSSTFANSTTNVAVGGIAVILL
jgi:hypothetical protein